MSDLARFLASRDLSPKVRAALAVLGTLSSSPWKFDVLWELRSELGLTAEDFPRLGQELFDVESAEEARYAVCVFDDLTVFYDVVGPGEPPFRHSRNVYRFAYLSLRPMVFRSEFDEPPQSPSTSEEKYSQRLLLLVAMLGDTDWASVGAVLRECAARYEESHHVEGAALATQTAELFEQLATTGVPQRGPEAYAKEALDLQFSASDRLVSFEVVLQWWPLYGEGFWHGLRLDGAGPVPGEDAAGSALRAEMLAVFANLAPFAWLAGERPGLAASVIGLAILQSESGLLPPCVEFLPTEWLERCVDTLNWLRRRLAVGAGLPEREVDQLMARSSSLLPAGEPSAAGDVTEDAADPAWPSTLDLDPDEVVTEVTRLNHQGMTHNWHRDFDTALLLGSRARDLAATHLGDRHFQYAVSVNTMATALEGLGDLAAARALFEEAVDVLGSRSGRTSVLRVVPQQSGNVELAAGNLDFAEDLFQRALTIMRSEFGEQDPRLVPTINNLAHLHLERDDVVKAEELLRAGLEIRRGAFGEVNPEYAWSLRHLGES